jgi:PAS domain S-box-containing protein
MSYIPRILVVDDEPHICNSLEILLKRQGYEIFTANSGQEALENLAARRFDLLLLDMVIPDMNGFQIIDHINNQGYEPFTIVITGNASIESAVKALKKGAFDYLKKPFEYEELLKRVGNALNQKKLVHEKKIINWELERSEERYQYLVQNSPDIIYTLDDRCIFSFINITIERLLGYPPDRLLGKHFTSLVQEEDMGKAEKFLTEREKLHHSTSNIELKLRLDGNSNMFKLFEIEHSPIKLKTLEDGGGILGVYGVARDITYRKQLEDQLQHAKKMEAIGTLAGGIAHDFNNILMGIMGYTSLLLSELNPTLPYFAKLKSIQQHATSGANLTKQLLGFARGGKYDVKSVDINRTVEKTSSMFGRTNKEISIVCTYEENIWTVEVDEGQIEQVLLNLYVNAWQAMPEGGHIYIETENVTIDKQLSEQLDPRTGNYVKITIRDTGIGMDEEVQQRIFEPFFTTKDIGKGTGLGLASAYGIIKNHGGNITVHSAKRKGTTFTIYIPALDKPLVKEERPSEDIVKGSETVLLVDDEDTMIDVGVEILETLGYKTLTARNGKDALKLYTQNKGSIDIVIIDLIMPGMKGGELYDKIKAFDSEVKALLASGYSIDGEAANILQRGCNGFIQKPFGIKELSQKLREILD